MQLSAENAEQIAATLLEYLQSGSFAWLSLDETDAYIFTFKTGAELEYGGWIDHSQAAVRVWSDPLTRISFSFGDHYFTLGDTDRIYVDREGLKIRQTAPNGHNILNWIKREGQN